MANLTYTQLTQNIDAMQSQGAKPEDIQGYINTYSKQSDGTYSPAGASAPAPAAAATQAPVTTDTSNGAFFPSKPTDNGLVAGLKTAGNLLPSAFNFLKGAVNSVNPLAIGKTASNIGTSIGDAFNEGDKGGALLKNTIFGLPQAAYQTLVPQAAKDLFAGNPEAAQKDVTNDPFGSVAPFVFGAKALASGADAIASRGAPEASTAFGDTLDAGMKKVAAPVVKPIAAAAKATASTIPSVGRYAFGQAAGLEPNTISTIASNPEAFSTANMAQISRPALGTTIGDALDGRIDKLSDTGTAYNPIKESATPITVDPAFLKSAVQDASGLAIDDKGQVQSNGSASVRAPGDVAKVQQLLKFWQPLFDSGKMTTTEFLNFRTDLAKMAKYDGGIGKSTDLENLGKTLRSSLNSTYRPQVPGLAEVDTDYSTQITDLNNLKKGLLDKNNNLTDGAVNKIANALGKGKDQLAARLEEISPGITKQIGILKAAEDLERAGGNKVGTYARSTLGTGGMIAGIATGNIPVLAASIAEMIISNPDVSRNIIRAYGYSKPLMTAVAAKLRQGASAVNNLPDGKTSPALQASTVFGRPTVSQ